MFYYDVNATADPARTAERLLALRQAMADSGVPRRSADTVLIATWNIREFDSNAYGARSLECLYYIAEICSHFDMIAVQEVRGDLKALDRVVDILGRGWTYIASDVTEGTRGNDERMAFLYDSDKVSFDRVAGEIVVPPIEMRSGNKILSVDPSDQFYRTPYLVGFRSGWLPFVLCTVHIVYGKSKKDDPVRVAEIKGIADFLASRAGKRNEFNNLILLGDFNIFGRGDVTMQALTDAGFHVPDELQSVPHTNTGSKKRHYDQIAFLPQKRRMETTGAAGVFNFFNTVYRDEDEALYVSEMGEAYVTTSKGATRDAASRSRYYRTYWRTHQMSDHLPMWIELRSDFSRSYLSRIAREG